MLHFKKLCDDIYTTILECSICHNTVREPRVLRCQHRFCDHCLKQNFSNDEPPDQLRCPTCQLVTTVAKIGIDELPLDHVAIELRSCCEQLSSQHAEVGQKPPSKCSACQSEDRSNVAVCHACAEKFEENVAPIRRKSSTQGQRTQIQYARLPIQTIRQFAYLFRLSYNIQENFEAFEETSRVEFYGKNDFRRAYKLALHPCQGSEYLSDAKTSPDVRYRTFFDCKTCRKLVCHSCEIQHRYHDVVARENDIIAFMDLYASWSHTMSRTGSVIKLSPNTFLIKDLLNTYMKRDEDFRTSNIGMDVRLDSKHISTASIESTLLICTICRGKYSEPKALPCQHSFCKACLDKYLSNWLTLNQDARELPCPKCRQPTDCTAGIDNLANSILLEELMSLLDQYNNEATKRGDKPSYDLQQNCGTCRASCSETVILCTTCVDSFLRKCPDVRHQPEAVIVKKDAYDRIASHMTCLCDASSMVLALQTPYRHCPKCNKFRTELVPCHACQVTMCRSCMFSSHPVHVLPTGGSFLEKDALLVHARNLSATCDHMRVINKMIDDLNQASVTQLEANAKQVVLGGWIRAPLGQAAGAPAFDRHLMTKMWELHRRENPSLFVQAAKHRENGEWIVLRTVEYLHVLGQLLATVIGLMRLIVALTNFVLS